MKINSQVNNGTWKKDLRLYVHVPFCVKKCAYCDFLSGSSKAETIGLYFDALYKEIKSYKDRTKDYTVSSIFIGGGTPSSVNSEYIVRLLGELSEVFDFSTEIRPEITIEVNPGTIDVTKLTDYKRAGINRISFGLQSTHDSELRKLGRIHSYFEFEENYKLARELGFDNINIDLMSALPNQTLASWEETLYRIVQTNPEHISAYSLIIEEGTPFYDMYGPEGYNRKELPSEEIDRLIYGRTKKILQSYGYERYEISNYSKKGYECKHNMAYWEGISYLGLGLGSSSLIDKTRFNNTDIMEEYLTINSNLDRSDRHKNIMSIYNRAFENNEILKDFYGIRRDTNMLTKNQLIEEFMYLGLRMTKGVSKRSFFNKFGISMDNIYQEVLEELKKKGLITIDCDMVRLTDYGIDVSNMVLAEFLLN